MEIDFSDLSLNFHGERGLWIGLAVTLTALLLGILGWYITPEGQVLTPTEWQIYRQHSQYRRELGVLMRHADRLAGLLDASPDPVRAQLIVEQMGHDLDTDVNLVTLAEQENALLNAGNAVLAWSMGAAGKNDAINALAQANAAIEQALDAEGVSRNGNVTDGEQ